MRIEAHALHSLLFVVFVVEHCLQYRPNFPFGMTK
jgi:hypothetical protein